MLLVFMNILFSQFMNYAVHSGFLFLNYDSTSMSGQTFPIYIYIYTHPRARARSLSLSLSLCRCPLIIKNGFFHIVCNSQWKYILRISSMG
jgi:hypothetical protein